MPVYDQNDNLLISSDYTGYSTKTLEDQYKDNMELIKKRLAEADEFDPNYKTRLGHSFDRTILAAKQSDANVKHKLFLDVDSGMYWAKGYVTDADGNLTEYKDYDPMGLAHIGSLKFNGSKPEVKMQFFEDPIEYEAVHGIDQMPEFYKKEWSKPVANQYVIESESDLATIKRVTENHKNNS